MISIAKIAEVSGITMPPSSQPMAVAREIWKRLYTLPAGEILRAHRGDFFRWDGTRWPEIDQRDVRADVYKLLEHATYYHPKDGVLPFAPTQRKVTDVLDALRAITIIESKTDAPLWIDRRATPPASEIVAVQNGLLHVPSRRLLPHTTQFFNHYALPFRFDPDARSANRWLMFLDELWEHDPSSISALQEIFGYILAGGTSQQKMFLLVGPKRGGKGTIGRVLTGLLGAHQVAAPTLAGLSTNFGLQPLIGNPLALISDARLSSKADSRVVVERLLSISGEDTLTIDRKFKDPWTGRLPTRFVIMTNELPRLSDASGALVSRFILLILTKSFYGRENPQLTDELLSESPAILNWSLEGLDRLTERGHFVHPSSGADALQQLEDLSAPVSAFIRTCCIVEPTARVEVDALWAAWKAWCAAENHKLQTKADFGKDLRAAVPMIKRSRPRVGEDREYWYDGIGLRSDISMDIP